MRKQQIFSAILFALFLITLPVVSWLMPYETFSEIENRELSSFPSFSWRSVKNRKFMDGIETFLADHFASRDDWVALKGEVEYLSGKRENNGIYIGEDRLFEILDEPSEKDTQAIVDAILAFTETTGIKPYFMLIPSSLDVVADELPANVETWDQRKYIKSVVKQLGDAVTEIDVYKTLHDHADEGVFYRTDHHWTTYGAFLAYQEAGPIMDCAPLNTNHFDITIAADDFYGTLYSKAGYRNIAPDSIEIYDPVLGSKATDIEIFNGTEWVVHEGIYFDEFLDQKDKYSVFFGQVQPIIKVHTSIHNGRKLLVFKDSFAHCFLPFLTPYYEEIVMVDLRYLNVAADQFVAMEDYSEVLMLYNINTFATSTDVTKLGWIGRE